MPDTSAGAGADARSDSAGAVAVADAAAEPGTQLSLDRIVRAAIALADAEGLEALHMRRLAAYLGAGTMSLYRHVSGRDDLIDHMVALALGEEPQPGTLPVGWRAGLEYTARRDWGLYQRHPWILQYAMVGSRMRWNHNAAADGERALSAFDGLGLSIHEQANLLLTITGFTQGMALIHANDVELTRRTGLTDEQWWNETRHQIPASEFADAYPRLAHAFGDQPPLTVNLQQRFDEGIKGILDGIGARLATRTETVGTSNATEATDS
ncbi:TetR/AcrR family transcriptional regulator [Embleya sp. NPDC050154]|uniref:TetR/AcrR family transcriptional regulator n=1 Tax=Embleya sp. NPDC050154 TaxID=3363988 RepID=UPI0037A40FEF